MPALWSKCKRCRRVQRRDTSVPLSYSRLCSYCPNGQKLHGIRAELMMPLEAAYLIGGIRAAQEMATPGRTYPEHEPEDKARSVLTTQGWVSLV